MGIKDKIKDSMQSTAEKIVISRLQEIEKKLILTTESKLDETEKNILNKNIKFQEENQKKIKQELEKMQNVFIKLVDDIQKQSKDLVKNEVKKQLKKHER